MIYPDCATVERLRSEFPDGSRVELIRMNDKAAPPVGTRGTVRGVDALGSVMVEWDNGSRLSVVYRADKCRRVTSEEG